MVKKKPPLSFRSHIDCSQAWFDLLDINVWVFFLIYLLWDTNALLHLLMIAVGLLGFFLHAKSDVYIVFKHFLAIVRSQFSQIPKR